MNLPSLSLSLCLLLGALTAWPAAGTAQTEEVQEWRGQYGGEEAPAAEVVTHPARLAKLCRRLDLKLPQIDFKKDSAVVAHAGLRPTGGYAVEFLDPVPQGDDLLVRWRVRRPAPGSYVTQALTRPWKVKIFARPKGTLKVEQVKD